MKKVLFMCINMNTGGTEKALLTMLNEMDTGKYDITLLMLEKFGGFLNEIPGYVNVKYIDGFRDIKTFINEPPQLLAKELIKSKKYFKGINTLLYYSISKITNDISYYYRYVLRNINKLDEEYDLAVAYAGPMDLIRHLLKRIIKSLIRYLWFQKKERISL